jgi:signal peptidase II
VHPLQRTGREVERRSLAILAAVVAADQATKLLVEANLPLGETAPLIPGVLAITHVHNRGIAFSLLGGVSLLVPAAIALTLLFLLFYNKAGWTRRPRVQAALALLGGGAIGNLIDRLRVGAVVDFVDVYVWPVFNVADVAVTTGAALLMLLLLIRGDR